MQSFGQPPGSPLGNPYGNPLDEDPLNDPLDPFDAMLNALTGGAYPLGPLLAGDFQDPLIGGRYPGIDNIGKLLGDVEADIENRSLMPPKPGMNLDKALDQLEESIEKSPPEPGQTEMPEIHTPQQNSKPVTSGKGTDDTPPLPYYLEDSHQATPFHALPYRQGGRVGRRGGRDFGSSQTGQDNELYCPIKDEYVSQDTCRDCEYYEEYPDSETSWRCTYDNEEES